tara:strand:- start:51445 stop:51759 length:315 start_codon:yes stop_codon:yes gene_type:complete
VSTNTVATPTLKNLRADIQASDEWFVAYVGDLAPESLREILAFEFTDGEGGSMSRAEILQHLIIHGAYHRGNIGMLLNACGLTRPNDTFTRFLHTYEPDRRQQR